MKRKSFIMGMATVSLLVASVAMYASADGANAYKSQGNIVCTNDTADTSDDVVFDASDFDIIDTIITDGKSRLATSLNAYPNTSVTSLDTFVNLSSAIDTITDVPSVYYYDKTTEGEDCKRYVLENGSYYPCDVYGVKTSDTALTETVTVVNKSNTSTPAAGEVHLVKYVGAEEANLSAGSAGYVNQSFILGSGADNIEYKTMFTPATVSKLTTSPVSTFSLNISGFVPNYKDLTADNFVCSLESYTVQTTPGSISYETTGNSSVNYTKAISKSYDPTTGAFSASVSSVSDTALTAGCYCYMEYNQKQGRTAYGCVGVNAAATFNVYLIQY